MRTKLKDELQRRWKTNFSSKEIPILLATLPSVDLSIVGDELQTYLLKEVVEVCRPIVQYFKPNVPPTTIENNLRLEWGRLLSGKTSKHVNATAPKATTYRRFWEAAATVSPFLSISLVALSCLTISEACVERGFASLEATITEARNQLSDSRVSDLMFLSNRIERLNAPPQSDEPELKIDQADAETLLAFILEGFKTTNRKRQRKELKRNDLIGVKYFDDTGKAYIATCTLVRVDRNKEGSWHVKWTKSGEESIWDPDQDWEWLPIQ